MIDSYAFGRVVIDGAAYDADVIIFADHVQANWWRSEGHRLQMKDLGTVLEYGPDLLLVGSGSYGVMDVPGSTLDELESSGIQVEVLQTAEACTRFNVLLGEKRRVVAALHITC